MSNKNIHVWDVEIRVFHWLLLISVAGAWLTIQFGPPGMLTLHEILGFAVGILLIFRFFWGFLGSEHMRFAGFVRGPRDVLAHMKSLLTGNPLRFIGHNPAGGAMIIVLLLVLAGIVVTGIMAKGGFDKTGPLAHYLTFAQGRAAREVHGILVNILLGLVGIHVAGVLLETFLLKENLIASMWHGMKPSHEDAQGAALPQPLARPATATLLAVLLTAAVGGAGVWLSLLPPLGVPQLAMDPSYVKECGSCHTPHHPSLLPSASWRLVMGGLDDHFGDDATLSEAKRQELENWLVSSTELGWDTKPGQRIPSTLKPDAPMRITQAKYWERRHRDIPEATFKTKSVGGKANCKSCHVDAAQGRFSKLGIAIPEEIKP
ncbi:MAG: cytochrome b/b6 domain-containing protein [Alphaproteobacteria bacterium]|nr:cytochrome b/b6 domain-containing protein [Alphaproteobacteria bacterium]